MCASWADIKINKTVSDFYTYNVKYSNFVAILNTIIFLLFDFHITNLWLFQFRGELKSLDVSWKCFLDPYFWGWSLWFLYNGIYPGRARDNHEAHRRIGYYSYQCQNRLEVRFKRRQLFTFELTTRTLYFLHYLHAWFYIFHIFCRKSTVPS